MNLILSSILIFQALAAVQGAQQVFSRPGSRGHNDGPLANLHEYLENARIKTGIPGMSVAVFHKGKLVFAEGFGKRNEHDPFTVETLTQIGSVTKSFTAATVGELVGEGELDWDTTPVSKYLPEFELKDPAFTSQITLQDLLSHRTGFPSIDTAWFFSTKPKKELMKRLKYVDTKPKMSPYVLYNNVMYAMAGEAAANVAGIPFEDLAREKIFKPLSLSCGWSTEELKKRSNFAMPYNANSFEDAQNGIFVQMPLTNMAAIAAPAGDMHCNVLDIVRWGQTIMHYGEVDGKQVLNKNSVKEMLAGQSIFSKDRRSADFAPIKGYGMGWILDSYKGNIMYHHSGHIDGYITNLALFPDSELVIGHLTNIDTAELPLYSIYHIADEILGLQKTEDWLQVTIEKSRELFNQTAEAIRGNFPKRIENKPSTRELSEFEGDYVHPIYGDLSIRLERSKGVKEEKEDELSFKFSVYEAKLEHYHYDTFRVFAKYSIFFVSELVTFMMGDDGGISGLKVKLDDEVRVFNKKE
ncbi:hypothetical protein BGZ80_005943 [Entomortierella chlamydospora]|uniref:Penicillin-binding protein n=1 Tax=Entomortierella chlamydospora TaxID=101097 RepID=A0A9P6N0M8_9FUNG|nr:hypothetical protein BGZ79_010447 [Entomortierella chlamydospora]KAG0019352.1 hypothetical protein BGZ80_005943 [Entomortierella chlamydospora]